jgi:multiple sugar transport system permease protein/raffinose/stachyose/melibiose transport system permease protein
MTTFPLKKSKLQRGQNRFVAAGLTPIMLYMLFFIMVPMVWAVVITLFSYSPVRAGGFLGLGGGNPFIGLQNFQELFSTTINGRLFQISVKNTLMFALLVLPLNLIITLPMAMFIESTKAPWKSIFRMIYFLPTVTSMVAVSLIWKNVIYHPTFGLINSTLRLFHIIGPSWLSDSTATVLGVPLPLLACIIAYVWQDAGYNIIIFMAGLQGIPEVFHEAAIVDGANAWQRFRHITLPLLRSTVTFVVVMTMLSSWQVFVIFFVMTDAGGPDNQTRTLVLHIYETAFRSQAMGLASAAAMGLFVIILVTTLVQMRLLRKDWEY